MKKWFLVQPGLLLALISYGASSFAAAEGAAVKEIGTKTSGGLEVTLISAPPRSQAQMEEMMKQMGKAEMKEMMKQKGMEGMMGMGGMMEMPSQPATHWLGVIVLDRKTKKFVPNLKVTLTAKGPVTRKADLMAMPGSYAQNISLPTGQYEVFVRIDFPKGERKPVEVRFRMEA